MAREYNEALRASGILPLIRLGSGYRTFLVLRGFTMHFFTAPLSSCICNYMIL